MIESISRQLRKIPIYEYYSEYWTTRRFRNRARWEERSLAFYRQFIEPGNLVFDVGANFGNRTKLFLLLDARVVAFEPQKRCASFLRSVFRGEPGFALVEAALGEKQRDGVEMYISKAHAISTLSKDWITATQQSGRFRKYRWDGKQIVRMTTLDSMIDAFGVPQFIKIDVEGYEYEVLRGLTHPVPNLSFEFAAENLENSVKCVDFLDRLQTSRFQFSAGESLVFHLPEWVPAAEIKAHLEEWVTKDKYIWGDVYRRGVP